MDLLLKKALNVDGNESSKSAACGNDETTKKLDMEAERRRVIDAYRLRKERIRSKASSKVV